jgi:hypothetical protein
LKATNSEPVTPYPTDEQNLDQQWFVDWHGAGFQSFQLLRGPADHRTAVL